MDELQRSARRLAKSAGYFSGYINYVCQGEIWPDAEATKDYLNAIKQELSCAESSLNKLLEDES